MDSLAIIFTQNPPYLFRHFLHLFPLTLLLINDRDLLEDDNVDKSIRSFSICCDAIFCSLACFA